MDPKPEVANLKSEILRISAKLAASSDPDVIEALQFKKDSLEEQLAEALSAASKAELEEVAEPTREVSPAELEQMIRAARAHFAAERKPAVRQALTELEAVAPKNSDVLELKADFLVSNKDYTSALPVIKLARQLSPNSKSIEEKVALVSLRTATMGSIENQLRAGLSDSPFMTESDIQASATGATVASLLLPGAGHLITAQTKKGFVYIAVWVTSLIILFVLVGRESDSSHGARNFDISMPMIFVGFVAVMTYMVALFECAARAKKGTTKRVIEHPRPPVDLPFE